MLFSFFFSECGVISLCLKMTRLWMGVNNVKIIWSFLPTNFAKWGYYYSTFKNKMAPNLKKKSLIWCLTSIKIKKIGFGTAHMVAGFALKIPKNLEKNHEKSLRFLIYVENLKQ